MVFRFPLATSTWGDEEIQALHRVIESGHFTMGEHVSRFERSFADYIGSKHCVMVNSGSSANLLMIAALAYSKNPAYSVQRGDEIIVPAVSWSTTYYPIHQYGLRLKFVDVDLETLNYDLDALDRAITPQTRGIMIVNLLGNPNDFDRINQIVAGRNIVLMEDNCESMGATFAGRKAGSFGCMGTFSSFFSHHISTMEGGMIVTDDEELFHLLLSLRAHGWTRNLPKVNRVCADKSDDPFEESFRFVLPGYNVRPLEMEGALGLEQVRRLPSLIECRRRNGAAFQAAMQDHPDVMIQKEIGNSSWFGFSLLVREERGWNRRQLRDALEKLGFETRPVVTGNFTKNEVVKYFDYDIAGDLTNADYVDRNGLFIGNHHYPIDDAIDALASLRLS